MAMMTRPPTGAPAQEWQAEAACRGCDADLFFPIGETGDALVAASAARAVCATCPVTEECLAFALENNQEFGIWGGLTPLERKTRARRRPRRPSLVAGVARVRGMSEDACTVWFNPNCSKCRGARDLLADRGVEADYVRYLEDAPTRDELERVMKLLGTDDPRSMMRTGEAVYTELGLAEAGRDALLDAMVAHPILIERPIVIRGDRAVIARPPEKLLDLL